MTLTPTAEHCVLSPGPIRTGRTREQIDWDEALSPDLECFLNVLTVFYFMSRNCRCSRVDPRTLRRLCSYVACVFVRVHVCVCLHKLFPEKHWRFHCLKQRCLHCLQAMWLLWSQGDDTCVQTHTHTHKRAQKTQINGLLWVVLRLSLLFWPSSKQCKIFHMSLV